MMFILNVLSSITFGLVLSHAAENKFEWLKVPASSMAPTINNGARVLIDRDAYKKLGPSRGDIVVFRYPKDEKFLYIKRVLGLPGDKIEMKKKVLFINDKAVKKTLKIDHKEFLPLLLQDENVDAKHWEILEDPAEKEFETWGPYTMPANKYFVLGDNRDHSNDSEFWGLLPKDKIVGKVIEISNVPYKKYPIGN